MEEKIIEEINLDEIDSSEETKDFNIGIDEDEDIMTEED